MKTDPIDTSTCCICGAFIDSDAVTPSDALSMDHVPPKQFYPKELRIDRNPNLWRVPTHKRCNEDYREDEEYFYHAMYAVVLKNNKKWVNRSIVISIAAGTSRKHQQ